MIKELIIQDWQQWGLGVSGPPRVICVLAGGKTNSTYLIGEQDKQFVLRLNTGNSDQLGIDRESEKIILGSLNDSGIAPKIYYFNVEQGICISEFIAGKHWHENGVCTSQQRSKLLAKVALVHNRNVDLPVRNYRAYLEGYWRELLAKGIHFPVELISDRNSLLQSLDDFSAHPAVLCHHDLVPSNIIEKEGELTILDWEYAAMGQREFDYAVLLSEWNFSEQDFDDQNVDPEKLAVAQRLYQHLCQLWFLLQK